MVISTSKNICYIIFRCFVRFHTALWGQLRPIFCWAIINYAFLPLVNVGQHKTALHIHMAYTVVFISLCVLWTELVCNSTGSCEKITLGEKISSHLQYTFIWTNMIQLKDFLNIFIVRPLEEIVQLKSVPKFSSVDK